MGSKLSYPRTTNKTPTKPSPLSEVHLRGKWHSQTKAFLARLAAIAVIIGALVLGTQHTIFAIESQTIFGYEIDVELQLALIGVINKVFDLLITTSLEDSAGVLVTLWMTSKAFDSFHILNKGNAVGARLDDFELKDELTKPWKSVGSFWSRWSALGWRQAGWVRLLLTLTCSIRVLLSRLAINTIAIPKSRWLPDAQYEDLQIEMPMVTFQEDAISWGQESSQDLNTLGSGGPSWHAADALFTASTYIAFSKLRDQFAAEQQGWRTFLPLGEDRALATDRDFATVDTRYNGSTSRGFAGQGAVSELLFHHLQAINYPRASAATGWNGWLNASWPSATVSCRPFEDNASGLPSTGSVSVEIDANSNHHSSHSFLLSIPPFNISTGPPFLGATCETSVSRLLFPTRTWITNNLPGSVSPNNYGVDDFSGNPPNYTFAEIPLPYSDVDANIAQRLATQVPNVLSRFDGLLSSSTSAAQYLILTARDLQTYRPEYRDDIEAAAPVVCLLMNYLLVIGTWNLTLSTSETTVSTDMQFEVIGSGPWLMWEWVTVAILAVLLLGCVWGMLQWVVCRIAPAEWMEVKGMLVAANSSAPLGKLRAAVTKGERETAIIRLGVRERGKDLAQVVEEPGTKDLLDANKVYQWI